MLINMEGTSPPPDDPALRDAAAILERATADELAASDLRERLGRDGLPRLEADDTIRPHLGDGEHVVEVRDVVVAERFDGDGRLDTLSARLYLTTERLLLVGADRIAIPLAAIDEVSLAGERVLLSLRDGSGWRLDAGWPRLLRVQVAAARAGVPA
jgi:hypothetical protein